MLVNLEIHKYVKEKIFLAPTGAQEVTLCVCMSVRPAQVCQEQSIFILIGQRALRALREH